MEMATVTEPTELIVISDEHLEKLGNFYTSEYVKLNQPWVRQTPFANWLARHMAGEDGNKT